jgi:predicted nucleotidyltransferase
MNDRLDMVESDLVQRLRAIAPDVFSKTPVRFAYLFGSYATGRRQRFSDLDLAVYAEEENLDACLKLELALSLLLDEKLGHTVQSEVRLVNRLPLSVQGAVLTEGILIYCRDDATRIAFESRTRMLYFDFKPTIDRYFAAYREGAVSGNGRY